MILTSDALYGRCTDKSQRREKISEVLRREFGIFVHTSNAFYQPYPRICVHTRPANPPVAVTRPLSKRVLE